MNICKRKVVKWASCIDHTTAFILQTLGMFCTQASFCLMTPLMPIPLPSALRKQSVAARLKFIETLIFYSDITSILQCWRHALPSYLHRTVSTCPDLINVTAPFVISSKHLAVAKQGPKSKSKSRISAYYPVTDPTLTTLQ